MPTITSSSASDLFATTISVPHAAAAGLSSAEAPVEKNTEPTTPETPLAERRDFAFMGTSIATGTSVGEVVATGMRSELGRIAQLLAAAADTATPLQRRLAQVSQTLLYICAAIVLLVAAPAGADTMKRIAARWWAEMSPRSGSSFSFQSSSKSGSGKPR